MSADSVPNDSPFDLTDLVATVLVAVAWVLGLVPWHGGVLRIAVGVAVAVVLAAVSLTRPQTALIAFVGLMPLRDLGSIIPSASTTYSTVVAVAGLAGLLLEARATTFEPLRAAARTPLTGALGLPFAAALLTAPWSLKPARSLLYSWRFLWQWAGAALFALGVRTLSELRRVLVALVATCTALSGLVALQAFLGRAAPGRVHISMNAARVWVVRPSAFYLDPNFLAVLLGCGVLAAAALAVGSKGWRPALPWLAAAVACLGGVALTGSRTALLSLAGGAVVVALTAPKGRRLLALGALLAALVVGVALVPSTLSRVTSVANDSSEPSLETRVLMGESMLQMLPRYWVHGTGLEAFEFAYPAYRKPGALARVVRPHQVPLAMWVEMGVPGLLAELAIAVSVVLALRRRARLGWTAEDCAVLAALVGVFVGALFQYFYYFEPAWLLLGLVASAPTRDACTSLPLGEDT